MENRYIDESEKPCKSEEYEYLVEELKLCGDLVYGRNYLWRKFLIPLFPIDFVFKQLMNSKLTHSFFFEFFL